MAGTGGGGSGRGSQVAIVGVAAGVEASTQCGPGDPAGVGDGGAKWLYGTKRTPSVLEFLCDGALKTDASEVGLFPLVGVHGGGDKDIGRARDESAQSRLAALTDVDVEGRLHDAGMPIHGRLP